MIKKYLIILIGCCIAFNLQSNSFKYKIPKFMSNSEPTPELVYHCAKHYGLSHLNVVVAQSILESGHYKYHKNNNLFGLYDSKNKQYYKFNTWQESVKAYKDKVQYRYKTGDYYKFLNNYAEDPNYINKVKSIEKRYEKDWNNFSSNYSRDYWQ